MTPKQVYDAWLDRDLLSVPPPAEGETFPQYRQRVGDDALDEDRLFHFALAELCSEDLDRAEVDHRLRRAIQDLRAL